MATKITNNLQIKNLFPTKAGGVVDVDGFKKFVEDGELLTLINECAEAMHGGSTAPVIKQMIENCQSKRCTDKNRMQNSAVRSSSEANEFLLAYLKTLREPTTRRGDRTNIPGNKAKWDMTTEEIDAIDDVETLRKIKNCMASHKSKDLAGIADEDLTDKDQEFLKVYEYTSKKLKDLKANKATVQVSDDLLEKLQSGKATTLSKAQVAELLKILGK